MEGRLAIKQTGKILFIKKTEIIHIKSSGDYVEIYIDSKKYVVRSLLSEIYEKLDKDKFFRIHRSRIVNLNKIEELVFSDYGEMDVKIKTEFFRVSRSYKNNLLTMLSLK